MAIKIKTICKIIFVIITLMDPALMPSDNIRYPSDLAAFRQKALISDRSCTQIIQIPPRRDLYLDILQIYEKNVLASNDLTVLSITPTPRTTAAPIIPFIIIPLASPAALASPRDVMYLIPPQIINMTAIMIAMTIRKLATLVIIFSTSCRVIGLPVVVTSGGTIVTANVANGIVSIAAATTQRAILIFLSI